MPWGEHRSFEALVTLGIAIGKVKYIIPEEMWVFLPGSVPYVLYQRDGDFPIDIMTPEEYRKTYK